MARWEFRSLEIEEDGTRRLVPLSIDQKLRVPAYADALETARASNVANPRFSNYFVREGIGRVGVKALPAGNIEYGLCQSLHGEESMVAVFRSAHGRSSRESGVVLGIIQPLAGETASPCGNCRDIMLDEFGKELEIVSGCAEGGIAVVAELNQYLFENFTPLSIPTDFSSHDVTPSLDMSPVALEAKVSLTILEGKQFENDAYSQNHYPERKYTAALFTSRNYFVGARDIMCEYHPIYPLRDAIRQARRLNDTRFWSVMIVGEGSGERPPHVMYKDRQHLLELNIQADIIDGREQNPPIFLVTHRNERITGLWKTSVKEWLPLPFSPYSFGPEFIEHLRKYYQSKML